MQQQKHLQAMLMINDHTLVVVVNTLESLKICTKNN